MPAIHPLACVDSKAELAEDVTVGPFSYIEAGVTIGAGSVIESHVVIKGGTTLGERNYVAQGAIVGGDPQDTKWQGEPTLLRVGNDNNIREYVTMHRATGEGLATSVGDHCFIMAYCHLGHNVCLQDHVTMSNNVGLSGHVTVESYAYVGGMTGVHQFVRIGHAAMVGGMTKVNRDVPPYMMVDGYKQEVHYINAVGLRRLGVSPASRLALEKALRIIYRSQLGLSNALETVRREVPITEEVAYLLAFEERRQKGKNGRGDQI
ncbi:acyl-ACP--UDP-N-acetylglucosamine O-acyltransferase [bacterium]|nr:MAG: acyl-ACP--UDP-N-acetylglucosamine O-acyltransferase [bacterium]